MPSVRLSSALVALCLVAPPAAAQFTEEVLLRQGAWHVSYVRNDFTGADWCEAATVNREGTSFDITLFSDGAAAMYIMDDGWDFGGHAYFPIVIDIDRSRWTIEATAGGTAISFFFSEDLATRRFLRELQAGNAVAVYEQGMSRPFARFSLSGSRVAINAVFQCWGMIQ
ncbi:hypothetical protein [Rhodovulum strictum]|uniref:Invasion associated locus B (IalB) protein n=1 Tax=Rhodovulum strictum TaxID=58314 RepID=A0A844BGL1_9RHOB|nr:hypothetical protein [Rhodovulum strictum]MRH20545.1 hypothetical protein [Rhodovulum strictum]